MFEKYKLENGATVILIPQNDTASLTTMVMYPVGSRYEPDKLQGICHYIEHLMFKGTQKRKNTLALTREIDRLGAYYNAFTGKEYTGYYIKVDASFEKISFDILSDMLLHSIFDPKEMEREKGPIVEELRMYKDNPIMNIDNIFEDLLFAGCPLGRDIGGTEKHVMNFKREETLRFKETYYQPSNMHIIVAGKIGDQTEKLLNEYFGYIKDSKKTRNTYLPGKFGPSSKQERIFVEKKQTDQAQLMVGFPAYHYGHKKSPALEVLNTILGGSMSSRLFIKIRERLGLAYSVSSGSEYFWDIGYSYVRAGLEARNINKAIKAIQQEIEKLISKGITHRELSDAKTHIRGGMSLSLENSASQANWYAKQALIGESETPQEWLEKIDAVTQKDIQMIAKEVFKMNQMRVAIIGDIEKEKVIF